MPVVVTRDGDGKLHAFENRCAHRGSLLVLNDSGEARDIICVYHNWSYDLSGNLTGVAFRKGLGGKGGMPADCRPETHGPRKLRVATVCGLVFGTLSAETPPLEEYLGPDILPRIRRVHACTGQAARRLLPNIAEQLEALHGERQGQLSRESAAHVLHHIPSQPSIAKRRHRGERNRRPSRELFIAADIGGKEYEQAGMRSAQEGFGLEEPKLLESVDEFGDGIGLQILSCFPAFVLQQTRNSLAVRRIVPRGTADRAGVDVLRFCR